MKSMNLTIQSWKSLHWKEMIRNRKTLVILLASLLTAAAGIAGYQVLLKPNSAEATPAQMQTAVARRGELVVFASGAGQVIPATQISIGFDESGTLSEILVSVGEKVQAGQTLARLQTERTEEEVALAVAQAELDMLTAQQALDEIYETAQMDAAEALKAVEDAQNALSDLKNSQLAQAQALQAIAEAEEALKTAYSAYNGTRSTADDNTIDYYYAQLVIAQTDLREAKLAFKDYAHLPDTNLDKARMQLKLSEAQQAYDSALRYYNAATGTGSQVDLATTAAEVAVAEATLADAKREYERIKDGPTPGEIAVAEATLALAQAEYETLEKGPDPAEIALAEAELANAKAQLEVAREEQAIIDLPSPMDGTILSIDASVGESVGTGAIITLADLSQPVLTVYLDETDIGMVQVGYEAEVVFDSLPDSTFTGHVIAVDPSLQSVSNVDTIVAQVKLDADTSSRLLSLPVGSNASVDVIGGRVEDTVLIPIEALRDLGDGEYAVFVMQDGEPKLRVVTVGLTDYTTAAITDGLVADEVVTTGVVETSESDSRRSGSSNGASGEMQPPPIDMMVPPP